VGLLPRCGTTPLGEETLARLPEFAGRFAWFVEHKPEFARNVTHRFRRDGGEGRLLAMVDPDRLRRLLETMLDEAEFLSPHGLRALAASHGDHPFSIDLAGMTASVDYEP